MNGRSVPAAPAAGESSPRQRPWSEDAVSAANLLAALVLSGLLHAGVVLLPYLGVAAGKTSFAPAGRGEPGQALNATLALAGEHRDAAPAVPAGVQSASDSSAAKRPAAVSRPVQRRRAKGANLLPLPAHRYYTTDQLTKRPQPLAAVELEPPQIRPIVASGKMVLKLWIDESGSVAEVTVEQNALPEAFARTAVAAFKKLRFTPGERNAQPVGTLMRIEVDYEDGRKQLFRTRAGQADAAADNRAGRKAR